MLKQTPHTAEFGTCELCFSIGTVDDPVFIFEMADGSKVEIDGYYWSWGDYEEIYIDNVISFAAYISTQEFPEDTDFNYSWLHETVDLYEEAMDKY